MIGVTNKAIIKTNDAIEARGLRCFISVARAMRDGAMWAEICVQIWTTKHNRVCVMRDVQPDDADDELLAEMVSQALTKFNEQAESACETCGRSQ